MAARRCRERFGAGRAVQAAAGFDEALGMAAAIPLAELGTIEVRAVYNVPGS